VAQRPRPLTPGESPLHYLGAELRHWRESRGLSQDALGARVFVSGDLLSRVEKAERLPTRELVEACDVTLGAGGSLLRIWPLIETYRQQSSNSDLHVDSSVQAVYEALAAGTMNLRVDEEGTMWADIGRRSFLVGGISAVLGARGVGPGRQASVVADAAAADDPFGFLTAVGGTWPDLKLSRPVPDFGVDWNALLPGGTSMMGSRALLQLHPARIEDGRAVMEVPDSRRLGEVLSRPERSLLVGAVEDGEQARYYVMDGRGARERGAGAGPLRGRSLAVPEAYLLDDLTYGILWAVANYDDGLQDDDQNLAETRADLSAYERLSSSAVSREAAPGLNAIAHMWLGSDFCARHILKALPDLPALPAFWTREQRGEEASAWLVFDHKYPYLRSTTSTLGGATPRTFCVPEDVVRTSPRHERILFFLAVALMEALGIRAQVTTDAAYEAVEGFVVAPNQEAIIANWVRGDGMWHVDVTSRSSVVREFTSVAQEVGAHSLIEARTAEGRLRALAGYLDLPWSWLVERCAALGVVGAAGLIQPRSRLLSTAGIDAACSYVGTFCVSS